MADMVNLGYYVSVRNKRFKKLMKEWITGLRTPESIRKIQKEERGS